MSEQQFNPDQKPNNQNSAEVNGKVDQSSQLPTRQTGEVKEWKDGAEGSYVGLDDKGDVVDLRFPDEGED